MSRYVFGIDVGGTTVKCGLFDLEGNVQDKWEVPTRKKDGGKYILPDVAASVKEKMAQKGIAPEDVEGLGVGVPGPVNEAGQVPVAVNIGWGFVDVAKEMHGLTGLKVRAGNDANVAALGEMWKGGARGCRNVVLATLGTGVGGGIIIGGKVIAGSHGHIHVEDAEEEVCNCGNKGCLEQMASATGIVRLARRHLAASDEPSLLRDKSKKLSAKLVFDAVKEGDALACEIADQFGWYLGRAFAQIAGVVDPEVFVLGGGVSKAGPILIDYVKKYYLQYVFPTCREANFVLAQLGNDAGIYGAAKLVLE